MLLISLMVQPLIVKVSAVTAQAKCQQPLCDEVITPPGKTPNSFFPFNDKIIPLSMTNFEDIRPYHDGEVKATIERLLNDVEFIDAICAFKLSGSPAWLRQLLKPLVKRKLCKELSPLHSVKDSLQSQSQSFRVPLLLLCC